jgi:hypothetical protein
LIVDTFHSHVNCFSFCSSSTDWVFIHRIAVRKSPWKQIRQEKKEYI